MSNPTENEIGHQLAEANKRISELETDRLRTETLLAVTQVIGRTLSLQDTFHAILSELQRVVHRLALYLSMGPGCYHHPGNAQEFHGRRYSCCPFQ